MNNKFPDFHSIFDLDILQGKLYWKKRLSQRVQIGKEAGYYTHEYKCVCIQGVNYRIHRIIWYMTYGYMPINDIDHINGNRSDNRLKNLRECTRRENTQNKECHRNGKLVGTHYKKPEFKGKKSIRPICKPWQASIQINGKRIYLGRYFTEQEAHQAYVKSLLTNLKNSSDYHFLTT